MSHLVVTASGQGNSQLVSNAAENCYPPDWFIDGVQGAVFGVLGHMMIESCEEMHREDPESLAPYVMSMIYLVGGGALEAYAQSKVGKAGAAFFGSFVASKLPFFGFTGKNIQYIVAAATGARVKRLIDKVELFG